MYISSAFGRTQCRVEPALYLMYQDIGTDNH